MGKTSVEIPTEQLGEIEKYKDRLGELLLLGLTQMKIQESFSYLRPKIMPYLGSNIKGKVCDQGTRTNTG
jgi:hypothetical protein